MKPLPTHSLRHTYVVLLMEAKADIKYIQKQLGHVRFLITVDVYAYISNKTKKKNTERVDSRLNDVFK
ncbi:tyrosine-type recombinase/integrase [Bacillus sp. Cr_A10]|uniref:tyrosine-type recombinase/integrase n=1 Tax=Bacillus sp. Cr_A10 TaxID=3033993 RepID=UPI0023DB3378|nr:tyrosine-type recombinase/integrase [Bacillus sp. Cr_A10]MDF2066114.1 tyrosine-type recombinase/integrase [Bacillus sp. Cr_A10]